MQAVVRSVRSLSRAAGLVLALVLTSLAAPAFAEGDAPTTQQLEERIAALRSTLEEVYVDARADHTRVRGEEFSRALAAGPFGDWLATAAAAVREDGDVALTEAADAALAAPPAGAALPLSAATMRVILPVVLTEARAAPDESPAGLFAAAVRKAFAPDAFEDVWDTLFQGHPDVRAFRESGAALAAATAPVSRDADLLGDEVGEPALSTMIRFGRTASQVGPWEGMTTEMDEKLNRRTRVRIKGFYMDRWEVTRGQYLAFLKSVRRTRRKALLPSGWRLDTDGEPVPPEGALRIPVTGVSYPQAVAYARPLGKRLPSEDEWEHAARGHDDVPRVYPWGADALGREWVHRALGLGGPAPVDQYPADVTPDGVRGMGGNVAEMVATLPDRSHLGKGLPKAGASVVTRGGSYRAPADECVTAWRWFTDPRTGDRHVGFRCVMDVGEYKRRSRSQK